MASNAVGVAYAIENEVSSVAASGPGASAGIEAGDTMVAAKIVYPKNKKGKTPDPVDVEFGEERSWPAVMEAVQLAPAGTVVQLQLKRDGKKGPINVRLEAVESKDVFVTWRGLEFQPIFRTRTAENLSQAVQLGYDETVDSLTMVFRFLQKLGGQVPFKMLGGPGTIAVAAGDAASQGLSSLLIFLTMLSANLAVINFLPIPLLDGGHMVFLAYEGVRGRPANEKVVLGLHMAGFAFIISLMVFVIGLDIQRWIL
jgi:regulator of sigma E protease